VNGDIIDQAIPWNATDWKLVHAGEAPLWNDGSGTGLPQFLNFESAALAVPTLVGYLFPLGASFLVTVIVKLLLAGLGTYWCGRLLGARPVAAALGGTTYMLSGPFSGWLGWSISGPLALAGFLAASAIWCYRRPRRAGPLAALAASVAAAVFGGFPEDYALLGVAFVALFAVTALVTGLRRSTVSPAGVLSVLGGTLLGIALAAPLWLPGISILRHSVRGGEIDATGLPLHYGALLFAQGYDGLPIAGNAFFGNPTDPGLYFETAGYVGLVALALALVALVALRRRPVVVGLGAMGLVCALLSYRLGPVSPVQRLVIDLGLGNLVLSRALVLLAFSLAVLGALGAQWLLDHAAGTGAARALLGATAALGLIVAGLWAAALRGSLPAPFAALRRDSLLAPTATLVVLTAAGLALLGPGRGRRRAPAPPGGDAAATASSLRRATASWLPLATIGALLLAQSLYLLASGVGINSYGRTDTPSTPALAALERVVGPSLLGIDNGGTFTVALGSGATDTVVVGSATDFGSLGAGAASFADVCVGDRVAVAGLVSGATVTASRVEVLRRGATGSTNAGTVASVGGSTVPGTCGSATPDVRRWQGIGLYPEMNLLYGIDELGLHDPTVPRSYFTSWPVPDAGQSTGTVNLFVPSVDTVALAHRYGVDYVLAYPGLPAPRGMTKVAEIAGSALYRVPGSARFTIGGAGDAVVSVAHPGDATYRLSVEVPTAATLVARVTASPGWRADLDGRAVPVGVADGSFLSLALPAGTHAVTLTYRPPHLLTALVLALGALVVLVGVAVENGVSERRSRPESAAFEGSGR